MKKVTLKELLEQLEVKKDQVLVLDALIEYLRLFLPAEQAHQVGHKKSKVTIEDCIIPTVREKALDSILDAIVGLTKATKSEIKQLESGDVDGSSKPRKAGKKRS